MCEPVTLTGIAVGAGIGATTSAITGGDPLQGAILGGAAGGFFPGSFGVSATAFGPQLASTFVTGFGSSIALGGLGTAAGVGLAGGYTMNTLFPQQQDYSQYYNQAGSNPIAYNTQQSVVTGSGGRQAAAVLASEIKQAKKVRQRQAEVEDFGLGVDLAGTGLQIA